MHYIIMENNFPTNCSKDNLDKCIDWKREFQV